MYYVTKNSECIEPDNEYEAKIMQLLDDDDRIKNWSYEKYEIPYDSGKVYTPDFLVVLDTGQQILVEIKDIKEMNHENTVKKIRVGKNYCKRHDMIFMVIYNHEVKTINYIYEVIQHYIVNKEMKR